MPGQLIPIKSTSAVPGSVFIQNNMNTSGGVREANTLKEFLAGNIPDFLRKFIGVEVTLGEDKITYLVSTDYLAIGTDSDYVRMPMDPHTAQAIADKYDCTLPTRKIVNDIWQAAANKLTPLPWGPPYNEDMLKSHRIATHNQRIQNQLIGKDFKALTAGHKKDVVLTNKLSPNNPLKRVAIYGWTQPNGKPIQDLNPSSHEDTYADYSHGIRLITNDVIVNNKLMRMSDVFADKKLSTLVSDEGILTFTKY